MEHFYLILLLFYMTYLRQNLRNRGSTANFLFIVYRLSGHYPSSCFLFKMFWKLDSASSLKYKAYSVGSNQWTSYPNIHICINESLYALQLFILIITFFCLLYKCHVIMGCLFSDGHLLHYLIVTATCFRNGKSFEQCKECLLKAADCHRQNRSYPFQI
jgi:hypothetical protein